MGEFTSNILDSAPPTGELESTNQLLGILVIVAILITFFIIKIRKINK